MRARKVGAAAIGTVVLGAGLAIVGLAGCRGGARTLVAVDSAAGAGGTLHVFSGEDFHSLDPGRSYFVVDNAVVYATQRPLYSYLPGLACMWCPTWRLAHR